MNALPEGTPWEHRVLAGSAGRLAAPARQPRGDGPVHSAPATDTLLAHHLGDVPITAADGRETTAHLGRTSTIGGFDLPGEFDLPPEEPVVLLGEVPWELRGTD